MRKLILISFVLLVAFGSFAQRDMKQLFNGKDLEGWETYVGPKEKGGTPIGLNVDPMKIFTVTNLDGAMVLHISGEINASIATKREYKNYHIRMVFKWGEKMTTQFNSGLLYHSYGDFGAGLGVWMSSHEFQLCTKKMGDSYCMGNSYFEIPVVKSSNGKTYTFSPTGEKTTFGQGQTGANATKAVDFENPKGEWNVIDLYCYGRTSVHVVNNGVAMVNYNSGKIENGKVLPLSQGKIQIQSEGGELFVKSLEIESIRAIPAELLR